MPRTEGVLDTRPQMSGLRDPSVLGALEERALGAAAVAAPATHSGATAGGHVGQM